MKNLKTIPRMIDNRKVLAIVPARSGSKGIPNKNIKEINSIPLVAYPIIAAQKAKYIDRTILTTDSEEIAKIGKYYGAEIPFIRPGNLATDKAVRSDVILHALDNLEPYDIIVYLEPTSPLTNQYDIEKTLEYFISEDCKSLVSICESPTHHPEYAVILEDSGHLKPFLRKSFKDLPINRQSLEPVYFFDGSIYISLVDVFRTEKEFYHSNTKGIVLDGSKALEIDSPFDFEIAKLTLENEK